MILFGHPTGNPNSHNAALAHFQAGRLEAFCVPWMPSPAALHLMEQIAPLQSMVKRLSRRSFAPLVDAPKIQGPARELLRLAARALGWGDGGVSYKANDWLMRTMRRECRRPAVKAVHAYEDCSLWQFEEARRLGKACLYDMPIGYYPAWEKTQAELVRRYADWLPEGGLPFSRYVRPAQKRREMEMADLVLAPSSFVEKTIRVFHPDKKVARAGYGVDLEFWHPVPKRLDSERLRFIYAGQLSIRKGIPLLLDAWEKAALRDAELELVGLWKLDNRKRIALPRGVTHFGPCSPATLRERFHAADVFVIPSFFEGFALALLEAMACGLPVIASEAAGPDALEKCGQLVPCGDRDALVESMRWFDRHREKLPEIGRAARKQAESCTWENYRRSVTEAVAPFI